MDLPSEFLNCFDWLKKLGYTIQSAGWTNDHTKRHVGAVLEKNGQQFFAKLAIANKRDLDEPNMHDGFERELWWSHAIQRLRQHEVSFPFRSPRVVEHNIFGMPEVVFMIFEYIEGKPIVDWEPSESNHILSPKEEQSFQELLDAIVRTAHTLEQIHRSTLTALRLSDVPAPPHGQRRAKERGWLDDQTAVLGNGAFEIKNFWRTPSGELVIMDNEFAGWYPPLDHLAYLFHRLYCNQMRPDLARRVIARYVTRFVKPNERQAFFKQLRKMLIWRVIGGFFLDMMPRRKQKFWPWHKKQRLRYGLVLKLLLRRHRSLM